MLAAYGMIKSTLTGFTDMRDQDEVSSDAIHNIIIVICSYCGVDMILFLFDVVCYVSIMR